MRTGLMILLLILQPLAAAANDRLVRVHAPTALVETGLLRHILPRFSLKTQIRVELVSTPEEADIVFGTEGRALMQGGGETWHVQRLSDGHKGTERLAKWLHSDVGLRTITGFSRDGKTLFQLPVVAAVAADVTEMSGDAALGHEASRMKCARCHAVDETTRMSSIGSTPSFFVLRTLPNWDERFSTFYLLNPHPAFTQVDEVTEPFPQDRPSPIVPVTITVDEVEAIVAYVAGLEAENLGKPLVHQ